MGRLDFIDGMIEDRLLALHTCFLAKVISVSGDLKSAKVLPLGKTKAYGENAVVQSPLSGVPIANHARWKFTKETIKHVKQIKFETTTNTYVTGVSDGKVSSTDTAIKIAKLQPIDEEKSMVTVTPIAAGDIVICICGERNITDAKKGINNTPPAGHHSMSDAIIIGIL